MNQNAVKMTNIHKAFPGIKAVDGVDLTVESGEIHGLIGENGAGKSTLMNMLYGILQPDEGEIEINGERLAIHSPQDAMQHGIGMVHQHFMLVPSLSVLRNIVLGNPSHDCIFIRQKAARAKIQEIMDRYGLQVDLDAKVYQLSVGQKQRVEIIKALYRDVKILILDEPTAVLTPQETQELIAILHKLKADGCSIIFITHKLKEVLAVASKITVMCKGKVTGRTDAAHTTERDLSTMMVGRVVNNYLPRQPFAPGEVVLQAEHLSCNNERGLPAVRDISLSVRRGEILGVAGVEGNGQTELVELLTGMLRSKTGRIAMLGKELAHADVRTRRKSGMSHIPEDRLKTGSAKQCSIADNIIANRYYSAPFSRGGVLQSGPIRNFASQLVEEYGIRAAGIQYPLATLSGGNMQKVILSREMEVDPDILIAAQPTRGVDIGAIEYIHAQLLKLRDSGKAILLVSVELSEIFALSDRIVVLYEGEIVGEFDPASTTEAELGLYMTGAKNMYRKAGIANEA